MIETTHLKNVIEAALLAAGKPLQITELAQLFEEHARPNVDAVRAALDALVADYEGRGIEVKETATGFRVQVRKELASEVSRLWPERPAKYSRALLETIALIAYRQPITRAEIEAVRGVAVNPNIIKTLLERGWVRVVGTRDVPGRPELLGTTREFLDYFSLKTLDELPPLAEIKAMTDPNLQLALTAATPAAALAVDGLNGESKGVPTDNNDSTGAVMDNNNATSETANTLEAAANGEIAVAADGDAATSSALKSDPSDNVGLSVPPPEGEDGPGVVNAGIEDTFGDPNREDPEASAEDETEPQTDERTAEGHSGDDEDETETRQAQASDDIGFDDEMTDDDDEDEADGNSAELVAARRNYED
jgi:segregation and condensation protein B